ncbi:hypothetical protein JOJ86_007437 [Rhodococcus percolatus]|uniref:hypothetical protein n=1 Tax=Rhodococcus opacus TaxID=37919 RepID=UPI0015FDDD6C|nr:hypothetical protein [Rhodococcus opacus]MBA8965071.1 hypothetical protein [Rhodococcus opacus]MBP2209644.1 hypothetical protein [Rhodococcus opacus]
MTADTRLDELARRIDGVPDALPVKSLYQAFFTLASNNSRPATADQIVNALSNALDEFDERHASDEGSLRL